jgi:predicted SAM-dependent methyltransferase
MNQIRGEVDHCRARLIKYCKGQGVDLGCGWSKIRIDAIGVDLLCPDAELKMDARLLDQFPDEHFDYVFSSHLLEEIENTEATLREWLRILKKDGNLVLYQADKDAYYPLGHSNCNKAHKHHFSKEALWEILKKIGGVKLIHSEGVQGSEWSFELVIKKIEENETNMVKLKQYKFEHVLQSPWITDIYKKYLPDIGFLVEIGVGHTCTDESRKNNYKFCELYGSNTAELLNLGWSGLYIEPIEEFCTEAALLHKDIKDRLKIINLGASDCFETCTIYGEETFIPNPLLIYKDHLGKPYKYPGTKIECKPTSVILTEAGCPKKIDFMSIDVEGYEEKVLRGINFNLHSPKILFIETTRITTEKVQSIIPKNYKLLTTEGLNSCFVEEHI